MRKPFASLTTSLLCHSKFQFTVSVPIMDYLEHDFSIFILHFDKFMLPTHWLWFAIQHTSWWNYSLLHFTTWLCIKWGLDNDMDSFIFNYLMEPKAKKQEKRITKSFHTFPFMNLVLLHQNFENYLEIVLREYIIYINLTNIHGFFCWFYGSINFFFSHILTWSSTMILNFWVIYNLPKFNNFKEFDHFWEIEAFFWFNLKKKIFHVWT